MLTLTSGDIQFLKLVAEGLSDEQIAARRYTKLKSVQSRYRGLAEALLPDGMRNWSSREEFIRHLKAYILPAEQASEP